MKPFDDYPKPAPGMDFLPKMGGGSARQDYGHWLVKCANQECCVYCDVNLVDTYDHWLLLTVDHAIPKSACEKLGIPEDWCESYTNIVLACSACNNFLNQYGISYGLEKQQPKPSKKWTVPNFIALRDRAIKEKTIYALKRHISERSFYEQKVSP